MPVKGFAMASTPSVAMMQSPRLRRNGIVAEVEGSEGVRVRLYGGIDVEVFVARAVRSGGS